MSLDARTTQELQLIAGAGGGFRIDGSKRTTQELQLIAGAASGKGARVTMTNMGNRTTQDLQLIGGAGKGAVSFED